MPSEPPQRLYKYFTHTVIEKDKIDGAVMAVYTRTFPIICVRVVQFLFGSKQLIHNQRLKPVPPTVGKQGYLVLLFDIYRLPKIAYRARKAVFFSIGAPRCPMNPAVLT